MAVSASAVLSKGGHHFWFKVSVLQGKRSSSLESRLFYNVRPCHLLDGTQNAWIRGQQNPAFWRTPTLHVEKITLRFHGEERRAEEPEMKPKRAIEASGGETFVGEMRLKHLGVRLLSEKWKVEESEMKPKGAIEAYGGALFFLHDDGSTGQP